MIVQWTPLHQTAVEACAQAVIRDEAKRFPYPDVPRIVSAVTLWLGHLEAENDCELNDIAREAVIAELRTTVDRSQFNEQAFWVEMWAAFALEAMAAGSNGGKCPRTRATDGIRCSLIETGHVALHVGRNAKAIMARWDDTESAPIPSWFETHPRFEVHYQRAFVIPPLSIATQPVAATDADIAPLAQAARYLVDTKK